MPPPQTHCWGLSSHAPPNRSRQGYIPQGGAVPPYLAPSAGARLRIQPRNRAPCRGQRGDPGHTNAPPRCQPHPHTGLCMRADPAIRAPAHIPARALTPNCTHTPLPPVRSPQDPTAPSAGGGWTAPGDAQDERTAIRAIGREHRGPAHAPLRLAVHA